MQQKHYVDAEGKNPRTIVARETVTPPEEVDEDGNPIGEPTIEYEFGDPPGGYIEVPTPSPAPFHQWDFGKQVWFIPSDLKPQMLPITKRQLRLTLIMNGVSLAAVETKLDELPAGMEREIAKVEWQDASDLTRNHPTLLLLAQALNLTEQQVDEMWIQAMAA